MNPILALVLANIIWGAAPPLFKLALTNVPPFTLAFARFFFAALIFLPFFPWSEFKKVTKKDFLFLLIASVFGITLNIAFFFLGLNKTESIAAPIIASAGPIFVFIIAIIFLHEKARKKVIIGMALSFIGVLVIVISPLLLSGKTSNNIAQIEGNFLYVLSNCAAIAAPFILKDLLKKLNVYFITCVTFLLGSIGFIPFMIAEFSTWSILSLEWTGFQGILFGIFFSSALAYYLYYYGLERIDMQEVGIFTYLNPVVTVIIAIPLLAEYPDIFFLIGSFLIFSGLFISEKKLPHHPHQKAH